MKKTPLYWSLAVGVLAVVWQVVTFYVRFGRWNDLATVLDYAIYL